VADDAGVSIFAVKFLLTQIFKLEEAVVVYTSNGRQAFETFMDSSRGSHPFTLMILDYNMPYMTGLEIVQAIDNR